VRFFTRSQIARKACAGFRAWLDTEAKSDDAIAALLSALKNRDWHKDAAAASALREPLMALCAHYLLNAKKDGSALDAVSRFHLGNGARLERLNWLADVSPAGMQRSAGMMVNYLYRLDEVEENHEAFVRDGSIATSHSIKKLARDRGAVMRKRGG
jgi:malonyl-CoA decarboxylase